MLKERLRQNKKQFSSFSKGFQLSKYQIFLEDESPTLRTPFFLLLRNMSLKTKKINQGGTEIFILEFEQEESLCLECNI